MELAVTLGTPLGLAQWKRASSLVEAGTSGFLSISDSNCRVPEELGQVSQALSCVQEWTSACLSSCSLGDTHLLSGETGSVHLKRDQRKCEQCSNRQGTSGLRRSQTGS